MNGLEPHGKFIVEEGEKEELIDRNSSDFGSSVNQRVSQYNHLNVDYFIQRIGGQKKVEEMKRINEILDRTELINGKLVQKEIKKKTEDIEEWKRGFMEGFEEAYKRLNEKS